MPELPEVETVRRALAPAMCGARIASVLLRRAGLRRPFSPDLASRVEGRRVDAIERRGKYLLVCLDSGDRLLMHLGMSGWFRIEPAAGRRARVAATFDAHDHVVFTMSTGARIVFNDPRRFGSLELVGASEAAASGFASLGPEPLDEAFTAASLAGALAGKRVAIKVALLDQRVVSGLGNIYASEALHVAGLSPRRRASTLATTAGRPRPTTEALVKAIRQVLRRAIAGKAAPYRANRFRVYERDGQPCRRAGCTGTIRRIRQAGRSTFYCPVCQR